MKLGALLPLMVLLTLAACKKEDMAEQQRAVSWGAFSFFRDDMTMQHPVSGTVARNAPDEPVPAPQAITATMLSRGEQRFDIDCAPCHGRSGDGQGMIVQRGFPKPPSLFSDELVHAKARQLFDVMTHGHGVMYSYADRVAPSDRWAIIAYIRALQRSQRAPVAELTSDDKAHLREASP